ncbi:hypothetical protein [Telluribacter sp.]|jgi:hypothetical protein|uniref:hypothetical protein n=1 Tax=Telluribacter sp. TaxID=1978767 RepID=UPI002E155FA4|nr:hypothetical protein [Telluribacter sp.]
MKKSISITSLILFTLLAGFTSTTFGSTTHSGDVQVRVVSLKENKVLIAAESVSAQAVTVELMDANKNVLFVRKIRKNPSFAESYNLRKLADGAYFIKVSNASYSYVVPVEIKGGVTTVRQSEAEETQRPAVRLLENKLSVYTVLAGSSSFSLQLYNDQQKVVYSEQAQVVENILNRRYDLSQLPEGQYNVLVTINGRVYSEEVAITR